MKVNRCYSSLNGATISVCWTEFPALIIGITSTRLWKGLFWSTFAAERVVFLIKCKLWHIFQHMNAYQVNFGQWACFETRAPAVKSRLITSTLFGFLQCLFTHAKPKRKSRCLSLSLPGERDGQRVQHCPHLAEYSPHFKLYLNFST